MADRVQVGPPLRLGARRAGAPVRTGWDATSEPTFSVNDLDDLDDVAVAPGDRGFLTRTSDTDPARFLPGPDVPNIVHEALAAHHDDGDTHPSLQASVAVVHAELAGHIASSAPHPQYDDMTSLTLLFENGLI